MHTRPRKLVRKSIEAAVLRVLIAEPLPIKFKTLSKRARRVRECDFEPGQRFDLQLPRVYEAIIDLRRSGLLEVNHRTSRYIYAPSLFGVAVGVKK